MLTHRCKGSLKHGVSIRFCNQYNFIKVSEDYEAWRLFILAIDDDFDTKYLNHIGEINYCPFCGKELN